MIDYDTIFNYINEYGVIVLGDMRNLISEEEYRSNKIEKILKDNE